VLGICVGMQMLANKSDEGVREGLGWVSGTVKALNSVEKLSKLPLPHMGWNDVLPRNACPLFKEIENDSRFYFLHSFYFECNSSENIAAEVEYGMNFTCAVAKDNIFGVQFHPEKSHHFGTTLLRNFARL
jgi:glutamine amidotransferase